MALPLTCSCNSAVFAASTPRSELRTLARSAEKTATDVYDRVFSLVRIDCSPSLKTCFESNLSVDVSENVAERERLVLQGQHTEELYRQSVEA